MTLFSEELEHDGPGAKYLVGEFLESKYTWEKVSYEKFDELDVYCSCLLFETEGILCKHILYILCRNYVTNIPESYILQRWRLDDVIKTLQLKMVLAFSHSRHSRDG